MKANEHKIQQLQLRKEWETNSAHLQPQLGATSWIGSLGDIKSAFGRVGTIRGHYLQSLGARKVKDVAEEDMATDLDFRMKEGISKLVCSLMIKVATKWVYTNNHVMRTWQPRKQPVLRMGCQFDDTSRYR